MLKTGTCSSSRRRRIASAAPSKHRDRTDCGSLTSPTSPPWEGFLFLACVIDTWSRRVVGWSMRDDLRSELAVDALGMALIQRRPAAGVSSITRIADRSTPHLPSARRCRTPACCRAWAAAATPSTTPSPRASSRRPRRVSTETGNSKPAILELSGGVMTKPSFGRS